jgi:hypothetical protein
VTSLRDHIIRQSRATKSQSACQSVREEAGDVRVIRSPEIDTASVTFPAGINLDERAKRMNRFWRKLVEFQDRDVLVVALCIGDDPPR